MPIRFLDMFAGIGGFRSGLERLGGFECVGYCEIDKYAKQAYDAMYPTEGELYFADARTIDPYTLPDIDLVCGGFPCQSFSIAGLRRGFQDDTRGTLFFEIARIAAVKRPPFLLLENVPGLLSHDKGRTFATILGALDELGYDVAWQILNSKDFGVPQSRKRVYIVGYLRERCAGEILSFTNANAASLIQLLGGTEGNRVYSDEGVGITLTSNAGGFGGKTGLYDVALPIKVDTKSGFQLAHPGDSIDLAYPTMNTRRGRVGEKIAHTVTPGNTQGYFFIDMNAGAKLTETARCITARQDSGISKHIYADKGISGTSVKNRDEFNRMIRRCKQGKIDMIITKSIARFARNTVDCLKYVRLLNDLGVDVYFEEQGIHSNQPGAEFYITIYGSIAQSESENISANIKWGKAQAAREGKVVFRYKNFLGYRKGEDGQPEIVPEEAETIRIIYDRFLAGDSLKGIAELLEEKGIKSPTGKAEWQFSTIQSILSNERYKGDAIINKTYITDCISKKVRVNNGERPKYYVENSHPAIIDSSTFGRVQEELARRSGKRKISRKAKTEQGKYSSKYALTELLVCGECKSAYRRCTWTASGKKKIVWRCINRIEYAKKYCHNSPSVEESILQRAVMAAIMKIANQNAEVLRTLKLHIGMGLAGEKSEDNSIDLQIRIAEIDAEFKKMLDRVSTDTIEAFDEETATRLMNEKSRLQQQLDNIADAEQRRENAKSRLDDVYTILDGIKNRPMEYDDQIVRQLLECVVVDSKEQITVIFKGGLKSVQPLTE